MCISCRTLVSMMTWFQTKNKITGLLHLQCSHEANKTLKMSQIVLRGDALRARYFFQNQGSRWLHFWVKEFPTKDAAPDVKVDKNTACDVYRWFREFCSMGSLVILRGPGAGG